jgi:hypothetical protein
MGIVVAVVLLLLPRMEGVEGGCREVAWVLGVWDDGTVMILYTLWFPWYG